MIKALLVMIPILLVSIIKPNFGLYCESSVYSSLLSSDSVFMSCINSKCYTAELSYSIYGFTVSTTTRGCFAAGEHIYGLYNSSFCGQGSHNHTTSYGQVYRVNLVQCCDDKDGCNSRTTSPIIEYDALKCSTCKSINGSKSVTLHTLCPNSYCASGTFSIGNEEVFESGCLTNIQIGMSKITASSTVCNQSFKSKIMSYRYNCCQTNFCNRDSCESEDSNNKSNANRLKLNLIIFIVFSFY